MYLPQNLKCRYVCIDSHRITTDNQLNYRCNPRTSCFTPAVLPQDLRENPLYYRSYRGITEVPVTMQFSTSNAALSIWWKGVEGGCVFLKIHLKCHGFNWWWQCI